MSLVVAVKQNDRVIMMADSVTSSGESLTEITDPHLFKIQKIGQVLVGSVGTVQNIRTLTTHKEWFDTKKEELDKKFICKNIIPRLIDALSKDHLLENGEVRRNKATVLIAKGSRLFIINHSFQVFEIEDFSAIGYTESFARPIIASAGKEEQLSAVLKALRVSASLAGSVREPFYQIDTKTLEYQRIPDGGGTNQT